MFHPSPKTFLTLAFACSLLLAACETPANGMKAKKDPVPLQKGVEGKAADLPLAAGSDKIAKLEQQIAALEKEVAANRPKIAKIDVMEQKFKDLSLGLDRIDATYNMQAAPVVTAPTPTPVPASLPLPAPVSTPAPVPVKPVQAVAVSPPKPPEKPPAAVEKKAEVAPNPVEPMKTAPAMGKKVVQDLRIGEKKEYSRMVLDLGQSVKINYDIDNEEKILVIDIPGFKWEAAKTKSFPKSLLISSYQAETDDKGSRLVVQLRQPAKIANYSNIEATGGKLPRAVLDVAAQ